MPFALALAGLWIAHVDNDGPMTGRSLADMTLHLSSPSVGFFKSVANAVSHAASDANSSLGYIRLAKVSRDSFTNSFKACCAATRAISCCTPWLGPLLVAVTAPVLKPPKLCGGPEWAWTATVVLETAVTAIFLEDVASIAAGRKICRAAPLPDWATTAVVLPDLA